VLGSSSLFHSPALGSVIFPRITDCFYYSVHEKFRKKDLSPGWALCHCVTSLLSGCQQTKLGNICIDSKPCIPMHTYNTHIHNYVSILLYLYYLYITVNLCVIWICIQTVNLCQFLQLLSGRPPFFIFNFLLQ
jgi:hypothetical protein